jgi:hypothetical protein
MPLGNRLATIIKVKVMTLYRAYRYNRSIAIRVGRGAILIVYPQSILIASNAALLAPIKRYT